MPKSVRISDELYDMAAATSAVMHRSLAQQIEHWAALGQALEAGGDRQAVLAAAVAHMHDVDRAKVAAGKMSRRDLHAIPKAMAKRLKYSLHPAALSRFDIDR